MPDDPRCLPLGRVATCDGDTATGCTAGRHFAIDCAAQGKRCVMGEEGAICRERTALDCTPGFDPARCEGDVLWACGEGQWQRWDCTRQLARCEAGPVGARCVRTRPFPGGEACGPCGCPPTFDTPERCDGRDNDGDGFVDENLDCPVVTLLPIIVTDDGGEHAYPPEELDDELRRLNSDFAREDGLGLTFAWGETVSLSEPRWKIVHAEALDALFAAAPLPADTFVIPVFLVDEIWLDDVPRPGVATPPNGMCGGQRRTPDPQPAVGGVAVGKPRWPTTLSHEIGHYLGLCHTHQASEDALVVEDPETGEACSETCALEGDGICDTPRDPGPPSCTSAEGCLVTCERGEQPDVANLMSYYPTCRNTFTAEQARTMRHAAELRRGWQPCLGPQGCACEPLGDGCPEGMTCRRMLAEGAAAWQCGLDGATLPGGRCDDPAECGHGSTCVVAGDGIGRCARPCALVSPGCTCALETGLEVPFCAEDLGIAPD